jgi:ComF family protein
MISFKALFNLFYPEACLTCSNPLLDNEEHICTVCRNDFPKTHFIDYKDNQAEKVFYGRVKIESAAAYYWYGKRNIVQELIFQLKYRNHQEIGELLANWIAFDMQKSERFKGIDFVIPVPAHPKKLKSRGYNQLTVFGETLAKELNCTYKKNVLAKIKNTPTQTKAGRGKRWENVKNAYALANVNTENLKGKHFLLIDDVLTTGATLEVCASLLLQLKDVKVSIITIAMGA